MLGWLKEWNRQRKFGAPVIVVSGLPRSGTSMMMKMLAASGVELVTDNLRAADEDNPEGYFEYERVKELAEAEDSSWMIEHRGKVIKVISLLLEDLPDTCFYKVVFMHRDLAEVLASQNKMLQRRGEHGGGTDDSTMAGLYARHLKKVQLRLSGRRNFAWLDVQYREVIENPREQAERVGRFIGFPDRAERMAAAVDRQLYRNRAETVPRGAVSPSR